MATVFIFAVAVIGVLSQSSKIAPVNSVSAMESAPIKWQGNTEIKDWTDTSSDRVINCVTDRIASFVCKQCGGPVGFDCCIGTNECTVITDIDTGCTTDEGKPC